MARVSKYRSRWTVLDGVKFQSAKEARRYRDLALMEKSGAIFNLMRQRPFTLAVNGIPVCKFVADFTYTEQPSGAYVVEDVKGMRTPIYKLKAKLMKACLGITIRET